MYKFYEMITTLYEMVIVLLCYNISFNLLTMKWSDALPQNETWRCTPPVRILPELPL